MLNHRGYAALRSTDSRAIGWVENGVLTKTVSAKKHLLKYLDAWALDSQAFRQARNRISWVRVFDTDSAVAYEVDADIFEQMAVPIEFASHGAQLALPRRYWTKFTPHDPISSPDDSATPQPQKPDSTSSKTSQLRLF